jgi:hypothetical protein
MWIAPLEGMLLSRCAWHARNYGHGRLLGVASWRGLRISFTDGICEKCAARVVTPLRRLPAAASPPEQSDGRASEVLIVALAVMTGLVLIARPTNDMPPPRDVAALLPRTAAIVQAPTGNWAISPVRNRRPRSGPTIRVAYRVQPSPGHQSP